jgi:uncharacterized membrane protein YkvA (DUF1232 family)
LFVAAIHHPMTKPSPLSPALNRYLSRPCDASALAHLSEYLQHGAACVTDHDFACLRQALPLIRVKADGAEASGRLRERTALFCQYLSELPLDEDLAARREIAFALLYFLRGADLIPDSVPKIGLLDDALLMDTAFARNLHGLRTHWAAHHRPWPDNP